MKPHPTPHQIRKTIKWGGAAVTVLLVVVWIGSGWCSITWNVRGAFAAFLTEGRVGFGRWITTPSWPWVHYQRLDEFHLELGFDPFAELVIARAALPLWLPVAMAGAVACAGWLGDVFARHRERRARLNLCPKCNYDRAGIGAGAVCPECGERPLVASEPTKSAPHA